MTILGAKRLGSVGRLHIEGALSSGKTLSQLVLRYRDLATGVITADLPNELRSDSLVDLSHGGVVSSEAADAAMIARIVDFLSSSRGALVIFEDQLAKPSDPFLQRSPTRMAAFGDELYHLLHHSDATAFAAATTLSWQANAWQEIIFFSKLRQPLNLVSPTMISKEELSLVARATVAISVSAFDGEGFATWNAAPVTVTV